MLLLISIFILSVIVPVGVGMLAHRRGMSLHGGPIGWGQAAAERFGSVGGAAVVFIVGMVVTTAVSLGLGFVAKAIENSVDKPTFHWVLRRVKNGTSFTTANEKLTLIGNNPTVQLVALVSVIILAFAYRHRWWIPALSILGAVEAEKYLQKFLGKVVDRGHPPTTLGTYPSGGVGRILAIYGTIIVLVIFLQPSMTRAWRAGLWTGVVTAAAIEAFSRVYLSKHWLTDALFGLPFGALLMLTNVAAVAALVTQRAGSARVTR